MRLGVFLSHNLGSYLSVGYMYIQGEMVQTRDANHKQNNSMRIKENKKFIQ